MSLFAGKRLQALFDFSGYRGFLRLLSFLLILVFFCRIGLAQSIQVKVSDVQKAFSSFEYKKVISLSAELLRQKENLSENEIIDVLRMRAIAYYVLDEDELATLAFLEILKIKPDYQLDKLKNSPKIISFFEKIKNNYLSEKKKSEQIKKTENTKEPKPDLSRFRKSVLRSIVFPGWGHLYSGQKEKGLILTGLSAASLSASVYFILRTNDLEKKYLNALEQNDIDRKYTAYNRSFKIRNGVLLAYALVWGYAQFDLTAALFRNPKRQLTLSLFPAAENSIVNGISLQYSF